MSGNPVRLCVVLSVILVCVALPPAIAGDDSATSSALQQKAASEKESVVGCCHRCGMLIKDPEHIQVLDVPLSPWLECCPVCALLDIIEGTESGSGRIVAHCDMMGVPIEVQVREKRIEKINPDTAVILHGGTCVTNKVFMRACAAECFATQNEWAKDKPVRTWPEMLELLTKKAKRFDKCSVCSADLKGHEDTWFIAVTKAKERKICCCAHCGIFMCLKEKDNIVNMTTADGKTLEMIDARDAFYVVGHDQVTCCVPATKAFAKKEDAEEFQAKHGGRIYTLSEAVANIHEVMKPQ